METEQFLVSLGLEAKHRRILIILQNSLFRLDSVINCQICPVGCAVGMRTMLVIQRRQNAKFWSLSRWLNTVFLYLCVIHRYFQTTGTWAVKIGKIQVQLKKIICVIGLSTIAMATRLVINQH